MGIVALGALARSKDVLIGSGVTALLGAGSVPGVVRAHIQNAEILHCNSLRSLSFRMTGFFK